MPDHDFPTEYEEDARIQEALAEILRSLSEPNGSGDTEIDYTSLYHGLFNGISLILDNTTTYEQTTAALKQLLLMAEEAYLRQGD